MPTPTLATIGYEATTVPAFLRTLQDAKVELLVDVRAVASSRRPGFAKSALAANLAGAGIEYLHLRSLGTPADGRAAARAGKAAEMHRIFGKHLRTAEAQDALETLEQIVRSGRRACLLCLEAEPEQCHRALVANALAERMKVRIDHLRNELEED